MSVISLEQQIEVELNGRSPEKITELVLDNCSSTDIVGLSDDFIFLENLSLVNVGLVSLKGLPNLPALIKLNLSKNLLNEGFEVLVDKCPNLKHLILIENQISNVDCLLPLRTLCHLVALDLADCDLTKNDDFREKVFHALPQLKYLDEYNKLNEKATSDNVIEVMEDSSSDQLSHNYEENRESDCDSVIIISDSDGDNVDSDIDEEIGRTADRPIVIYGGDDFTLSNSQEDTDSHEGVEEVFILSDDNDTTDEEDSPTSENKVALPAESSPDIKAVTTETTEPNQENNNALLQEENGSPPAKVTKLDE